jgi:basic membrane lipoprotein Med (substrate-binding protein (PBP1-ABC) superfamily)
MISSAFPQAVTIYITTSGTSTTKNVAALRFALEEGSCLAEMIAGMITRTGAHGPFSKWYVRSKRGNSFHVLFRLAFTTM